MNNYLFEVGSHFKDIRTLLGWTQEDVAEKIGVSRNTIVNIERNPANMKKNIAYSFYLEIYKEIYDREEYAQDINKNKLKSNKNNEIKQIFNKIGLTGSVMSKPTLIPVVVAALGSMAKTSSLLNLFGVKDSTEAALESIETKELLDLINKSLEQIKAQISGELKISDIYQPIEFIRNIENG